MALLVLFGLALLVLTLVAPATFAAATPPAAVQAGCAVGHGATASAVGAVCSPPPGSFGAWGGAIWMFLGIFALVCLVLRWRLRG
ncbi:MAG: hypothetical protein H0S85_17565 [Desulfovibrionaceae bacterium]|nr:hypothetical protein [Desulfovibrionaceae bacterium]